MANSSRTTTRPQFVVRYDDDGTAKVTFNGVDVRNVKRVSVGNDFDLDDVARSSITIDLTGEHVHVVDGGA